MNNIFHEGEYHIQETMGVREDANALSSMVQNRLPFIAKRFLIELKFAVFTLTTKDDDLSSGVVYDKENFIEIQDDSTIIIFLKNKSFIPKSYYNKDDLKIGFIGIDFEQAMRIRINGKARIKNNKITVFIDEAYGNCPKYIKKRIYKEATNKNLFPHLIREKNITNEFKDVISCSDTFFLATSHKKKGADISHKGGKKGFVDVISKTEIQFTDMPGNNLFNSLGNIYTNSLVNLLFIDFSKNDIYLVVGKASINEIFKNGKKTLQITINCTDIIKSTNSFLLDYTL